MAATVSTASFTTSSRPRALTGFWAEATVTGKDGSTRKVDVTPDEWRDLPVATQTAY